MKAETAAAIEALYRVTGNGKAEIVNGELVLMSPTGVRPGRAATAIASSLRAHERRHGGGYALEDNVGFLVDLPHRQSFSPDAAWYTGRLEGLDFAEGPPAFAAEVRSKGDYGPQAEQELAAKRADYVAAGTLVVWDVDLFGADVVRVYRANAPTGVTACRRGEIAEAEPVVPGWRMPVDELLSRIAAADVTLPESPERAAVRSATPRRSASAQPVQSGCNAGRTRRSQTRPGLRWPTRRRSCRRSRKRRRVVAGSSS